jgi:hypothetical protein
VRHNLSLRSRLFLVKNSGPVLFRRFISHHSIRATLVMCANLRATPDFGVS